MKPIAACSVALAFAACGGEKPAGMAWLEQYSAPAAAANAAPPGPSAALTPAAPPPVGGAPVAGADPSCERLSPKALVDAAVGSDASLVAAAEPGPNGQEIIRCERRTADIEQHFGYFVQCGKSAKKAFTALKKQMKKVARGRRRGRAWRSAFAAPGTFAWLTPRRRCYGQVAGRLLLRRPEVGEQLAQLVAQNLQE